MRWCSPCNELTSTQGSHEASKHTRQSSMLHASLAPPPQARQRGRRISIEFYAFFLGEVSHCEQKDFAIWSDFLMNKLDCWGFLAVSPGDVRGCFGAQCAFCFGSCRTFRLDAWLSKRSQSRSSIQLLSENDKMVVFMVHKCATWICWGLLRLFLDAVLGINGCFTLRWSFLANLWQNDIQVYYHCLCAKSTNYSLFVTSSTYKIDWALPPHCKQIRFDINITAVPLWFPGISPPWRTGLDILKGRLGWEETELDKINSLQVEMDLKTSTDLTAARRYNRISHTLRNRARLGRLSRGINSASISSDKYKVIIHYLQGTHRVSLKKRQILQVFCSGFVVWCFLFWDFVVELLQRLSREANFSVGKAIRLCKTLGLPGFR